ncbi:MAG: hypothetical protein Hyperionvirus5_32 [Hyperionvirus sp.]|uniref:Uncharacterized protein n=1 Tax=Hyperionvirus sp. TaxID=2487770 RepID=A0A3G5A7J4_9VIRU|nr:MAG: hypothetical protein Hyperionvirus5_32 [Hyperionvirus sp.]
MKILLLIAGFLTIPGALSTLNAFPDPFLNLPHQLPTLFEKNNYPYLQSAFLEINQYHALNGAYPKNLEPHHILNIFCSTKLYDSRHVLRILDTFEIHISSLNNLNFDNFFTSDYFLFDHREEKHTIEAYAERVNSIMAIANRISGKDSEIIFVNSLLTHQPRKFILDLIIKYSTTTNNPIRLKDFAKYAVKPSWLEAMHSNGMISAEHLDIFLQTILESDVVDEYIVQVINNFLKIDDTPATRKMITNKLVHNYLFSGKPAARPNILNQITKLNYKFTPKDIKKISLEVYDLQKNNLPWNYLRNYHPDFIAYFKNLEILDDVSDMRAAGNKNLNIIHYIP